MSGRPLPVPDEQSQPFWDAAAKHVLTLPRCSNCRQFSFPPDLTCPHCQTLTPAFAFEPVASGGKLRTWTIIRQSFLSGFETPFVLADVELDAQKDLRMIGQLLDGPEAPLKVGARVEVAFEDLAPGTSVPAFKLVKSS